MPAIVWDIDPEVAMTELVLDYTQAVEDLVVAVIDKAVTPSQNYMKDSAPWTDRSGNARQGLASIPEHTPGQSSTLYLTHGMEYGIWLEIRWSGRYAIITPTVDVFGPQIFGEIERRMR